MMISCVKRERGVTSNRRRRVYLGSLSPFLRGFKEGGDRTGRARPRVRITGCAVMNIIKPLLLGQDRAESHRLPRTLKVGSQ